MKYLVVAALTSTLMCPYAFAEAATAVDSSDKTAVNGNIDMNTERKPPEPSPTYEPSIVERKKGFAFRPLCRSFDVIPASIIVLIWDKEGRGILNPQQEDLYPKTADLKSLTYNEAIELFGTPKQNGENVTFELMMMTGTRAFREKSMYQLQTKFLDGKLASYEITGDLIRTPHWWNLR